MSADFLEPQPSIVATDGGQTLTGDNIVQIADHLHANLLPNPPPVASDETKDPDIFWLPDPCDDLLPSTPGFVSDCVYRERGKEVPKLFTQWSSLFSIASVIKRQAWVEWEEDKLFTNLYLLIVGRAGVVHKGSATSLVKKLIDYIDAEVLEVTGDKNITGMKMINAFTGSATSEALISAMQPNKQRGKEFDFKTPQGAPICYDDGTPITWYPTSEISIVQAEMSTFMNKSSFLDSLIPFLLNQYDAFDDWANNTGTRGNEGLRSILINLIGNTTPNALKDALPQSATADGFLSRCLIIYQPFSYHEFYPPKLPKGAPSTKTLRRRLAWIAGNTFGSWTLTEEAQEYSKMWYSKHKAELRLSGMFEGIKSRLDTIVLRVAALIRWQRYEREDQFIHLKDFQDAAYLLQRTFEEAIPIYRMMLEDKSNDRWLKIEEIVRRYGVVTRKQLIQEAHVPTEEISYAIDNLQQQGMVEIRRDGKKFVEASKRADESYHWVAVENKTQRRPHRLLRDNLTPIDPKAPKGLN